MAAQAPQWEVDRREPELLLDSAVQEDAKKYFHSLLCDNHRYLIEVDCSLGQFKSAKLKDKVYTINAPIFFHNIAKKEKDVCTKFFFKVVASSGLY